MLYPLLPTTNISIITNKPSCGLRSFNLEARYCRDLVSYDDHYFSSGKGGGGGGGAFVIVDCFSLVSNPLKNKLSVKTIK